MLEKVIVEGLIGFGVAFAWTTFPLFYWIRNFVARYISEKLTSCYFCITFWTILLAELSQHFYYKQWNNVELVILSIASAFGAATTAYILAQVIGYIQSESYSQYDDSYDYEELELESIEDELDFDLEETEENKR